MALVSAPKKNYDGYIQDTGIVVDNFTFTGRTGQLTFFLTHFHTDHTVGLSEKFNRGPIYCSWDTKKLLRLKYPKLKGIRSLDIGDATLIKLSEDSFVTVTLLDANHCFGSVMLLLDCKLGRILHTGDFRSDGSQLAKLNRVDWLYLDCTFLEPVSTDFPSRTDVIQHLIKFIQSHDPKTHIRVSAEMLGTEPILQAISRHFRAPWFIDREKHFDRFQQLQLLLHDSDTVLTSDPKSTRFQVVDKQSPHVPRKCVLYIKPGTRWFVRNPFAMAYWKQDMTNCLQKDKDGVWHLFWAMHSSSNEISSFISKINPREVIPTCGIRKPSKTKSLLNPGRELKFFPLVGSDKTEAQENYTASSKLHPKSKMNKESPSYFSEFSEWDNPIATSPLPHHLRSPDRITPTKAYCESKINMVASPQGSESIELNTNFSSLYKSNQQPPSIPPTGTTRRIRKRSLLTEPLRYE